MIIAALLILTQAAPCAEAVSDPIGPIVCNTEGGAYQVVSGTDRSITRNGPVLATELADVNFDGRADLVVVLDYSGPGAPYSADVWDLYPGLAPRLMMACSDWTVNETTAADACSREYTERHSLDQAVARAGQLHENVVVNMTSYDTDLAMIGYPNWLNTVQFALAHAQIREAEARVRFTAADDLPDALSHLDDRRAAREALVSTRGVTD